MNDIEPYWRWRNYYTAEEDIDSPFYGREYSELQYSTVIYNHFIHPQWDFIDSPTLFLKILFVDYDLRFCIIEFIGEWNDVIHNDIEALKNNIINALLEKGINKFVLIGENILNIHVEEDDYYSEWYDDLESDGWIVPINFREHVLNELKDNDILSFFEVNSLFEDLAWRKLMPNKLFKLINKVLQLSLNH